MVVTWPAPLSRSFLQFALGMRPGSTAGHLVGQMCACFTALWLFRLLLRFRSKCGRKYHLLHIKYMYLFPPPLFCALFVIPLGDFYVSYKFTCPRTMCIYSFMYTVYLCVHVCMWWPSVLISTCTCKCYYT